MGCAQSQDAAETSKNKQIGKAQAAAVRRRAFTLHADTRERARALDWATGQSRKALGKAAVVGHGR